MTFGSGATGCLGHGNFKDVPQVNKRNTTIYLFIIYFITDCKIMSPPCHNIYSFIKLLKHLAITAVS